MMCSFFTFINVLPSRFDLDGIQREVHSTMAVCILQSLPIPHAVGHDRIELGPVDPDFKAFVCWHCCCEHHRLERKLEFLWPVHGTWPGRSFRFARKYRPSIDPGFPEEVASAVPRGAADVGERRPRNAICVCHGIPASLLLRSTAGRAHYQKRYR